MRGDHARASAATGLPAAAAPAAAAPPVSAEALALLARADAELLAGQFAPETSDRFVHAHLAAIRAAAAVLAVRGRPGRRSAARTVWEMLTRVAPELETWAAFFAGAAALRSRVEAGRRDLVTDDRAESALAAAEDFRDAVEVVLGAATAVPLRPGRRPVLAVRVS
jgi:hypothetical protein